MELQRVFLRLIFALYGAYREVSGRWRILWLMSGATKAGEKGTPTVKTTFRTVYPLLHRWL